MPANPRQFRLRNEGPDVFVEAANSHEHGREPEL